MSYPPIPHADRFRELYHAITATRFDSPAVPHKSAAEATMFLMEYEVKHPVVNQPDKFLGVLRTRTMPIIEVDGDTFMEDNPDCRVYDFSDVSEQIISGEWILYRGRLYTQKRPESYLPFLLEELPGGDENLVISDIVAHPSEERLQITCDEQTWTLVTPKAEELFDSEGYLLK